MGKSTEDFQRMHKEIQGLHNRIRWLNIRHKSDLGRWERKEEECRELRHEVDCLRAELELDSRYG